MQANCDTQLLISPHAYLEDLAKYAAKVDKVSSIACDVFGKVGGHVTNNSSGKSVAKKLFIKAIGERGMEIQDVIHQILSLKLYNSLFKVQTISLENSDQCEISSDGIEVKNSLLDIYVEDITYGHELLL